MRSLIKKLLPKWVLTILKQIRSVWIISLFQLFHLFPINKKRVVICNVWGFGDNAKYITEELAKRRLEMEKRAGERKSTRNLKIHKNHNIYEIIFITNHPQSAHAPEGVWVLKNNSVKAIRALATAKVWVDNNRKESYIRKRKGQYYIQTWHGGIALKKIEKDYEDKLGIKYINNAKKDSQMTDLYVSNSNFCTSLYQNSFWYKGEILECGSPRNDILLNQNPNALIEIRTRLGVKSNVKIAIYAPTYREGNDTEPYNLDFNKLRSVLEKRFSGKWVIAVRLHPLVSEQSSFLIYDEHILNATPYRDIYELLAVGELLITDYSNIMFEFSFMKKPVFLYASDEEEYTKERGFYFKYDSLPYDRAKTQEKLIENIEIYKEDIYQEKVQAFLSTLAIYENGNASEQVVDRILEVLEISV